MTIKEEINQLEAKKKELYTIRRYIYDNVLTNLEKEIDTIDKTIVNLANNQ